MTNLFLAIQGSDALSTRCLSGQSNVPLCLLSVRPKELAFPSQIKNNNKNNNKNTNEHHNAKEVKWKHELSLQINKHLKTKPD